MLWMDVSWGVQTVSHVYVGICVTDGAHCVVLWSGVFVNFLTAATIYLEKAPEGKARFGSQFQGAAHGDPEVTVAGA